MRAGGASTRVREGGRSDGFARDKGVEWAAADASRGLLHGSGCTCEREWAGVVTPIWKTGMSSCARYSDDAFGVVVCLTQSSWSKCAGSTSWNQRCTHVVNVLYQLLDNDGDGAADDPALLSYMIREQYMCAESPLSSALRSALPGLELSCPRLQDEDPPQRE